MLLARFCSKSSRAFLSLRPLAPTSILSSASTFQRSTERDSSSFATTIAQTPMTSPAPTHWDGKGLSQEEFMMRDECILVTEKDEIAGHSNKYNCHRFIPEQPSGALHRAFSVFLFNNKGELLLQQRAHSKITFPGVWTNTCCSHQLFGYEPTEVDQPEDIAQGKAPGTVRAALRKLEHELGVPPSSLDPSSFRFLTRLHYCAGDVSLDSGEPNGWGEHEMDYIVFVRAEVALAPNPDEVADVRYVSQAELRRMMEPGSGLRWSPWFRIIAERLLPAWWKDLDRTIKTGELADLGTIHKVL